MDLDRIAIVLHQAVIQKLQQEAQIPETLNPEQVQASYDCTYDILQESVKGRDVRIHKVDIQKEATLRSINEIPQAIRNVSISKKMPPPEDTSQDNPQAIQDLVKLELERRGIQDQDIGTTPLTPVPPSSPPPPLDTQSTSFTDIPSFPPTQPASFLYTPSPPIPTPTQSTSFTNTHPRLITTLVSSPGKGTDGLRWEHTTPAQLCGVSRVRIPYMFVSKYPYLLLQISNSMHTITHPLIHTTGDWFEVPKGANCLNGMTGPFKITITSPDRDIISTRFPLKEAVESHSLYTIGCVDPTTGVSVTDYVDNRGETKGDREGSKETKGDREGSDETKENREGSEETKEDREETKGGDVILLFEDHAIVVFFLSHVL